MLIGLVMALALGLTGVVMAEDPDIDEAGATIGMTITETYLVDIDGDMPSFVITPTEAGAAIIVAPTDEDISFLQYTSILGEGDDSGDLRTITVAPVEGFYVPPGLNLNITAAACAGVNGTNYDGTIGTPDDVDFTAADDDENAKDIVTGIGTGYTGTGAAAGLKLTYDLTIVAVGGLELITATTTTIKVNFVISN